jgi:DNA-binding transcriptional ArsR family regulator
MTAGELSDHFGFAKPTMSAHFAVLKEADLVEAHKDGKQVIYRLKLSVLEDALLGFASLFAVGTATAGTIPANEQETPS